MKNKLLILTFLLSFGLLNSKDLELKDFMPNYQESEMFKQRERYEEVWKDVPNDQRKGWKQFKRWEYFWAQRLYPNGDLRNAVDIYNNAYNKLLIDKQNELQSNTWNLIGPVTNPNKYNVYIDSKGLGRVNIVRFHPKDEKNIWIGSATGGVWHTIDGGKTWENFPFTQFLSLGVSDIAISPTDPNIVYVATGDADGSLGTGGSFYSIGVIKTTDGGKTWNVTNLAYELANTTVISRLQVKKDNPNVVLAATNNGIYKTTNGGADWQRVGVQANFRDLELKPNDNNFVYAATFGNRSSINYIYLSKDFGDTWTLSESISRAGRIQLAVTPDAPENLYVLASSSYHEGFHSFRVSEDAGNTYTVMSDSNTAGNPLNWGYNISPDRRGQSSYDLCLAVNPSDKNSIIMGGIDCHYSSDQGKTWNKSTNVSGRPNSVIHVDMHDLEYCQQSEIIYLCNDGGIYISKDEGKSWEDLSDGLSITQYYKISCSTTNPNLILGGAQDNGTSMFYDGEWHQIYGGDGMLCQIDPKNDKNMWVSIYNGKIYKSSDLGKTFTPFVDKSKTDNNDGAWITPFIIDPNNTNTAYVGFANIWKTTNGGFSWQKLTNYGATQQVFTQMAMAPSNSNYIYASKNNNMILSKDGGINWTTLEVNESAIITSITVHPDKPDEYWYTLSGFNPARKVIYYNGKEFINLTGNLPNVPVNSIAYVKNSNDKLYIGTDIGMFYSDSKSNNWENINGNLPNVIINDLKIFYPQNGTPKLRAGTYGRGVWETDINNCSNTSIKVTADKPTLKCPDVEITLTADGEYSNYLWNTGETTKSIKVKKQNVYSVTATNGQGCKIRSNAVSVNNIPTSNIKISVLNNAPPCIGDTLTVFATNGFKTYKWSSGETTRDIKITKSGKYTVVGTKENEECEAVSEELVLNFTEKPKSMDFQIHGGRLVADSMPKYQWYKDGNFIPGAIERIYTIPVGDTGMFKVFGANENGCGVFSSEKKAGYSSVKETFTNVYSLYPNPSKGEYKFRLFCTSGDKIEFTVTDVTGRIVKEFTQISNSDDFSSIIDLTNNPDGTYLMNVKLNGKEKLIKLIKK